MSGLSGFAIPPFTGNAIALVAYYAVFLAAQLGLALRFLRTWNWPIFLGLVLSMLFQTVGSIAYLKLHYTPFTGTWYNIWIVFLSIGPIFFISSLHFCIELALRKTNSQAVIYRTIQMSRSQYLVMCCSIDMLSLVMTIIGGAYASAKSSDTPSAPQPGFDVLVTAATIELCNLLVTFIVGCNLTYSYMKGSKSAVLDTEKTIAEAKDDVEEQTSNEARFKRPRLFLIYLSTVMFVVLLLSAWAIVRAIDLAGGIEGPLQYPLLVNIEQILIFIAILAITIMQPAFVLPAVN